MSSEEKVDRILRALEGDNALGVEGIVDKIERIEEDVTELKKFKTQALAWGAGIAAPVGGIVGWLTSFLKAGSPPTH